MGLREKNILSLLEDKTCDFEDRVSLSIRDTFGWKEFTYKGLGLLSRKLARYLIEDIDFQKGEKIAILSESKPEYGACVFASVLSGAVSVPLDIKLTKFELNSILNDAKPSVILASRAYLETAIQLKNEIESIKHIIVIDEHAKDDSYTNIYDLPDKYNAKWRRRSLKSRCYYNRCP